MKETGSGSEETAEGERSWARAARLFAAVVCFYAGSALAQAPAIPAPTFDIVRFDVQGNTLIPADEVSQLVAPYTGKHKNFGDVQHALEALEHAYRDRGFGVVQVILPEQDITQGIVRFRIVEPTVRNVLVEGNKHFSKENIRHSLPSIREGVTPNSGEIARNLQLTGEHPVKKTNVLLRSAGEEGKVDVAVKVEDEKPWRAFATLDNTGTSETGYWRAGIGYQHTNLFGRDHTLTAQYITSATDPHKVSIYGLGYRIPFYAEHSSLDLIAGYSDVDSGTVQGLFDVSGSGTIFGARWNYYLPRWGDVEQKLAFGLDYRAFRNQVTLSGVGLVPDITIHPVSVTYIGRARAAAAETTFYGGVATNIPGGNDGEGGDFERSRAGATENYTILRFGVNHVHALYGDWQIRAAVNAQYTSDSLVAGEQFGLGGPDSVRGYLVREVANDRGYAANFELYTPDWGAKLANTDTRLRFLAFYDYGSVRRNNALPGESHGETLASAGFGMRLGFRKNVTLRADVAQILEDAGTRASDEQRLSVGLVLLY